MINEVIQLREADKNGYVPTLTTFILGEPPNPEVEKKRASVLICPGGGYRFCNPREGETIAAMFNAAGYHAFVLHYSVAPHVYPDALTEVSDALRLIRKNAEKWSCAPDKIAVCGFSAGGHLAASIGTLWNTEAAIKCGDQLNRPNALILCYPVISGGKHIEPGTYTRLLGDKKDDPDMLDYLSLEKRVTKEVPPTFLWHTFDDAVVPLENSLLFADALRKNDIPFEMHIYPTGIHALSSATEETCGKSKADPHVATWTKLVCEWLKIVFYS